MFDWVAIYNRFAEVYEAKHSTELARILGVSKQSTHYWKTGKSHVPWRRLKKLVDEKCLSWDWLIEGKEPKLSCIQNTLPSGDFDWTGMSKRFLGLFPDKRQTVIAKQLGVAQETVSKWSRGEKHVPWEKLKYARISYGVSWEWLIQGYDNQRYSDS